MQSGDENFFLVAGKLDLYIYGLSVYDSKVLDFCEEEVVIAVLDP